MARAGARCLYCGAELPAEAVAAAAAARAALEEEWAREARPPRAGRPAPAGPPAAHPAPAPSPPPARVLLVLPLGEGDPARLGAALGLSRYEAGQLLTRGGPHLHRILAPGPADAEAERLRAAGLEVWTLPEEEVRKAEPIPVTEGRQEAQALVLETAAGSVRLAAGDLLLVVQGPITRDYAAATSELKRLRTATLEPGFRVHLHRRRDVRPLELDPANLDFGPGGAAGGAQRQVLTWLEHVFPGVPRDDTFRRAIPALAPAAPPPGALKALARQDARVVLDNLAQFRFHSAWRATYTRRQPER